MQSLTSSTPPHNDKLISIDVIDKALDKAQGPRIDEVTWKRRFAGGPLSGRMRRRGDDNAQTLDRLRKPTRKQRAGASPAGDNIII